MLILSVNPRCLGDDSQDIIITTPDGDQIIVRVTDANEHRVRIGFDAPKYIDINRRCVQERINSEKEKEKNAS